MVSKPTAVVRHGARATRSIWPAVARALLVGVAVLAISSVSLTGFALWRVAKRAGDSAVPLSPKETVPPPTAIDGAFNVLLVGADNAAGQHGFGKAREGALNDVNILVHVSADHTSGTVVSLPRDLVIPHPECVDAKTGQTYSAMSAQQLNVAYSRGGLGCVVTTVESLTGVDIPYAGLFTFEGTVKMADAVGGVPVCVTKAVNDTESGLELPKGVSTIRGRTALAYLRARHRIGDGSDLARIQSQQAYMSALLRKMTSAGTLADPAKLYSLATTTADTVTLSTSLADVGTLVRMAVALKSVDLDRMVFVQYPTVPDPANRDKVVPDPVLADRLVKRVQRDRPVVLDAEALGVGAVAVGARPSPTSSPSTTKAAPDERTISGLRGRTAAQQTCSVVNRSR
jgi:LCP family protein required for cell wall assembly